MNWNGHKILLIGFIISSVLLMICLSGCQTDTGGQSPSKIHDLIVDFNESAIVGAEEFIPFHDPLLRKQYLTDGWIYKQKNQRKKFPWPLFSRSPGIIRCNWPQVFDRRIRVKLLNVPLELPDQALVLRINNNSVIQIPGEQPFGEFEFFLPCQTQNIGENIIEAILENSLFEEDADNSTIAIHSLAITHGAVVKTSVPLNNQIRPSLLLAAPIAIRFPVSTLNENVLIFDYGMFSYHEIESDHVAEYTLDVTIYDPNVSQSVQILSQTIRSSSKTPDKWHPVKVIIPDLGSAESSILFEFKTHQKEIQVSEYLALSDIRILPKNQKWNISISDPEPDVLLDDAIYLEF